MHGFRRVPTRRQVAAAPAGEVKEGGEKAEYQYASSPIKFVVACSDSAGEGEEEEELGGMKETVCCCCSKMLGRKGSSGFVVGELVVLLADVGNE